MTDIQIVKMLSGNNEISDEYVAFQLESVEQMLLAYCNIKSIPDGLRHVMLEIAAFKVKANTTGAKVTLGGGTEKVASVSDGNQSISFSSSSTSNVDWNNDSSIIAAYADVLGRFRRMVVETPVRGCHYGARRIRGGKL